MSKLDQKHLSALVWGFLTLAVISMTSILSLLFTISGQTFFKSLPGWIISYLIFFCIFAISTVEAYSLRHFKQHRESRDQGILILEFFLLLILYFFSSAVFYLSK